MLAWRRNLRTLSCGPSGFHCLIAVLYNVPGEPHDPESLLQFPQKCFYFSHACISSCPLIFYLLILRATMIDVGYRSSKALNILKKSLQKIQPLKQYLAIFSGYL